MEKMQRLELAQKIHKESHHRFEAQLREQKLSPIDIIHPNCNKLGKCSKALSRSSKIKESRSTSWQVDDIMSMLKKEVHTP